MLGVPGVQRKRKIMMFKEFKEFAMRGNVLDMAIGIIIGAAFGKIVSSFVADVLMPPIGLLLGKVNFSNLFINLGSQSFPSVEAAKSTRVKCGASPASSRRPESERMPSSMSWRRCENRWEPRPWWMPPKTRRSSRPKFTPPPSRRTHQYST
jgi:hypothetical protein